MGEDDFFETDGIMSEISDLGAYIDTPTTPDELAAKWITRAVFCKEDQDAFLQDLKMVIEVALASVKAQN